MYILEYKEPGTQIKGYMFHEEYNTIEEALEAFHATIHLGYEVTYFSAIYLEE